MSQLGPVVGNRFADTREAALKPHLRQRLAVLESRSTPLGTIATNANGRLSFTPKDDPLRGWYTVDGHLCAVPRCAFRPGQRVRVDVRLAELMPQGARPGDACQAEAVAGCEGVVAGYLACDALTLVVVDLDSGPWAFMPQYLAPASLAEGDDERAAMASGPAFDPYSEPLALGDTVQGMDGRIGRVSLVEPYRLSVVFERGSAWCGDMVWRGSLRLLAKAATAAVPSGCDLHPHCNHQDKDAAAAARR
jgi:hypothetical protein